MHRENTKMKLEKTLSTMVLLSLLLVWAGSAGAGPDARALLQESEARHRSHSQQYAGELTVVNREGKVRSKGWISFRQGYAGDAKNLIRFTEPPEVRGVGYLSLAQSGKNPDQWLYLPSMKRERRIAGQERDASFVGTDFSYEDMEEFDHTRYDVSLLGEESVDGQGCHVIVATPTNRSGASVYDKKIIYLRKDILYVLREDLFRRGDKEAGKRLRLAELEQIDGHWVARRMEMTDLKKHSTTTVLFQRISFDQEQPADRFTLQNLNREGGD